MCWPDWYVSGNGCHLCVGQIPIFPVVKKDLTFIHLGNDSYVDGLINFEKLRMIAKEIRHNANLCSAKYVSVLCCLLNHGLSDAENITSSDSVFDTYTLSSVKSISISSLLPAES